MAPVRRGASGLLQINPASESQERRPAAPVNPFGSRNQRRRIVAMKAEGKKLATLATDGFEESELFSPKEAIEAAGGSVEVVSIKPGDIQGLKHMERGRSIHVDKILADANPEDYDAILIPGGLFN